MRETSATRPLQFRMVRSTVKRSLLQANACLWLSAGVLVGCQSNGATDTGSAAGDQNAAGVTMKAGEGQTLVPQSDPLVEDLPVPIGFNLDVDASRSYRAHESRLIDHVYRGPASKREVERFYRRLMPLNGWRLQGSQQLGEEIRLRYQQGDQWCEVEINPWNRLFGGGSVIRLTVQTLASAEDN